MSLMPKRRASQEKNYRLKVIANDKCSKTAPLVALKLTSERILFGYLATLDRLIENAHEKRRPREFNLDL